MQHLNLIFIIEFSSEAYLNGFVYQKLAMSIQKDE